ncbi:hypothetical protein Nit79A3_2140 [Nitrosomonas sp. Is79A3]|uniref:hypothetical protein n=1 Tax=Nitrosomonas sp. (strain Is79A3) TaxID=261292 RepID=UPI000215D1FB
MTEQDISKKAMANEQLSLPPLVAALRQRAKRLKYISTLYLVLILVALGGGGFLFYWLPQILAGQEQMLGQVQQLSVEKGTLEASREFAFSRWKNQYDDARAAVLRNGFVITKSGFNNLSSVSFITAQTGWAVGEMGSIYKLIILDDALLMNAKTLDEFGQALDTLSNENKIDLKVFQGYVVINC